MPHPFSICAPIDFFIDYSEFPIVLHCNHSTYNTHFEIKIKIEIRKTLTNLLVTYNNETFF